jgi:hypothetical protein
VRQSLLDSLGDAREDGLFVGEFTGFKLRVDQFAVHSDFEATTNGGNEREIVDLLFEVREQLGCQTDSLRFVPSDRAVFQFQIHGNPPGAMVQRNYMRRETGRFNNASLSDDFISYLTTCRSPS